MEVLMVIVGLIVAVIVAVWLFIARQGNEKLEFYLDTRTPFTLQELTDSSAVFSCQVDFKNTGTQECIILDAFSRHHLPYEQYDGVEVYSRLELATARRSDGYYEAMIVEIGRGGTMIVTVKLTARSGNIVETVREMNDMRVDLPIDLVYQVVARRPWYMDKVRIELESGELLKALAAQTGKEGE